jgi:hypothetical protein
MIVNYILFASSLLALVLISIQTVKAPVFDNSYKEAKTVIIVFSALLSLPVLFINTPQVLIGSYILLSLVYMSIYIANISVDNICNVTGWAKLRDAVGALCVPFFTGTAALLVPLVVKQAN